MKNFYLIVLACCLGIVGCRRSNLAENAEPYSNRLASRIDTRLRKEGYMRYGSGGGLRGGTIRYVMKDYYTTNHVFKTVDEARRAFVPIMNSFLTVYNQDTYLRPALFNYPFKPGNIQISIVTTNNKHQYPPEPYISIIKNEDNLVVYGSHYPTSPHFRAIHAETFEQAQKILDEEQKNKDIK